MKKFIQTSQLKTSQKEYQFYSLAEASRKLNRNIENLPYSLKILLENLVRNFDGEIIKEEHLLAVESRRVVQTSMIPANETSSRHQQMICHQDQTRNTNNSNKNRERG